MRTEEEPFVQYPWDTKFLVRACPKVTYLGNGATGRGRVVDIGGGSASLGTNGARVLSDFELRISVCAMARKVGGILTRQKTGFVPQLHTLGFFLLKNFWKYMQNLRAGTTDTPRCSTENHPHFYSMVLN